MNELHEEQQRALEEILECDQPVFVTGSAGTGKSFLLRETQRRLEEFGPVGLAAPTGIAALNIGGITLHSMFGLSTDGVLLGDRFRRKGSEYFQSIIALLIDEVSMVRVDIMNNVDRALRYHRDSNEPFGGLKIVLFGDPFQLPPVLRVEDWKTQYDEFGWKWRKAFIDKYFFQAPGLLQSGLRILELTHIHRQGSDLEFAEILNRVRKGRVLEGDFTYLNRNSRKHLPSSESLRVFGKNEAVDAYNNSRFISLPESPSTYRADWLKNPDCVGLPLRSSSTPENTVVDSNLNLKPGARVMFIKNDDQGDVGARRWVNGSLGEVVICRHYDVLVALDSGETVSVGKSNFDVRELVEERSAHGRIKIYGTVTGWFHQYPLKLAWAVSVHKSQGQTLENLVLDFDDQYFEAGQAYVALSRARRLQDIYFQSPISPAALMSMNPHVTSFMEKAETYPFNSRKLAEKLFHEWSSELKAWCETNGLPLEVFEKSKRKFLLSSTKFKNEAELNHFLLSKYKQGRKDFHRCLKLIHDLNSN